MFERFHVTEDSGHRVVVAGRDRVEFVVVAAGAAEGLCEKRLADRIELLVDDVHDELVFVLLLEVRVAQYEKTRRHLLAAAFLEAPRRQEIAGDLLAHELVERHVGVEGVDRVIAIAPGGSENEAAEGQRLGEPGDVEPVPSPALAEVGRGEEAVDERFISDRRRIVNKRIDILGRGRQSDQVKRESPRQRCAVGFVL